jgi:hypothetical protein
VLGHAGVAIGNPGQPSDLIAASNMGVISDPSDAPA